MYRTRYNFQRRPFPPTPDTSCYYPATCHEQVMGRFTNAIEDGEGIVLLTGQAGTGKTLLCHCLLGRLGKDTTTAFLTNTHLDTRRDFLQAVLYDLELPHTEGTELELRLRLTEYLLKNYAQKRRTVIVIDEAQHLSIEVLEEIRLLSNLETAAGKAVQTVLVANPLLRQTLLLPELASLNQRVAIRMRLSPLGIDEAIDFLCYQVRVAGGSPDQVFTSEALEVLAQGTRGIPRLLNQAALQSLRIGEEMNLDQLDAEVACEALAQLGLEMPEEQGGQCEIADDNVGNSVTACHNEIETSAAERLVVNAEHTAVQSTVCEQPDEEPCAYRLFDPPRRFA